jgi:hypothetical protein
MSLTDFTNSLRVLLNMKTPVLNFDADDQENLAAMIEDYNRLRQAELRRQAISRENGRRGGRPAGSLPSPTAIYQRRRRARLQNKETE